MSKNPDFKSLMQETKFFESYSRFKPVEGRYETWRESIRRVMSMHETKYSKQLENQEELREIFKEVEEAYNDQLFLGSQRSLQFGGDPILNNNSRMYNCTASYADRANFFGGAMHLMLSGCGVGFSVQKRHVKTMPSIKTRELGTETFVIPDSIEGWAEAVDVLISSYMDPNDGELVFPEYSNYKIRFDYSKIRPEGSHISGGFIAPGPDGLKKALEKIESIFEQALEERYNKEDKTYLKTIEIYDIVMHCAVAVLSGGKIKDLTIAA